MSSRRNCCASKLYRGLALAALLSAFADLSGQAALAGGFLDSLGYETRVMPAVDPGLDGGAEMSSLMPPDNALPDGEPGLGANEVREAWLILPTRRYRHGVLGDAVEAGGLLVRTNDGAEIAHVLPDTAVFEDRTPRVADLDGDGRDEIVVVRSYRSAGAALAVFGLRDGVLMQLAETPPIGQPNRWLNPAGIADFDGDGHIEIAYVETPHIGGTLYFYRYDRGGLRQLASAYGFSNHAIGSRKLGLSAAVDLDGDGAVELILPEMGRRNLAVVSLIRDRVEVRDRIALPAAAAGDFRSDLAETLAIRVPLADGREVILRR